MRRVGHPRTLDEQIDYHLKDGRAPDFSVGQTGRVDLARFLVDKILRKDLTRRPLTIVELGCGSGDISGPYSGERYVLKNDGFHPKIEHIGRIIETRAHIDNEITVHGYDITPAAQEACATRWPDMQFHLGRVEDVEPFKCDILVMTEFLEHLHDPALIVGRWMPLANFAIIGHPLNDPDPPYEPGHIWSYTRADWYAWFEANGHHVWEEFVFPMGANTMILGHGSNKSMRPYTTLFQ